MSMQNVIIIVAYLGFMVSLVVLLAKSFKEK
jgi:preprotein translocase subunit Sec61beta